MANQALPSRAELLQLFDVDLAAGLLWWRARPIEMFPNERLWKSWNTSNAGKPALTNLGKNGYLRGSLLGKNQYAHRVLWKIATGNEPALIDHKNTNPTDNRIDNLRPATKSLNSLNVPQTRARGVHFNKRRGKFYASIGKKHIGVFADREEAEAARAAAYADTMGDAQ